MIPAVLVVQAAASLFMTGLVWFVQVVHYPLMGRVEGDGFARYEVEHSRRTTWVVVAPMLAEAMAALAVAARRPPEIPGAATVSGLLLLAVVWISTAWLQVPQHAVLSRGFDPRAHRRLVATNWIRTAAWTARGGLALWMLVRAA